MERGRRVISRFALHLLLMMVLPLGASVTLAAQGWSVPLPPRPRTLSVDLVTALERRQTTREFASRELSLEDLSAVLWAANGVNRPDGRRTAPSAHGEQYIDLYVITDRGSYRYDALEHRLEFRREGRFKKQIPGQPLHAGLAGTTKKDQTKEKHHSLPAKFYT